MCFDLCWTFSRAKIPVHDTESKKFFLYSLVSWGVPAIGTLILILFQLYLPDTSILNPRIGDFKGECFVPRAGGRIRFLLYLPMLVLMFANVVFFIIIVSCIFISKFKTSNIRTSTRGDKGKDGSRVTKRTMEQLKLYMKLFVVVGLLWCGEGIHNIVHTRCHDTSQGIGLVNSTAMEDELNYENRTAISNITNLDDSSCSLADAQEIMFRIVDCLNLLRGLFLFIIFVCKKNIYIKLKQKLAPINRTVSQAAQKRSTLSSKMSSDTTRSSRSTSTAVKAVVKGQKSNGSASLSIKAEKSTKSQEISTKSEEKSASNGKKDEDPHSEISTVKVEKLQENDEDESQVRNC